MILIPDSIYPKDSNGNPICPRCAHLIKQCTCPSYEPPRPKPVKVVPTVRLDKSNRSGKVVTLIGSLPKDEGYLKTLAKQLKSKTGSGGTFYITDECGIIELQGDHREVVQKFF